MDFIFFIYIDYIGIYENYISLLVRTYVCLLAYDEFFHLFVYFFTYLVCYRENDPD